MKRNSKPKLRKYQIVSDLKSIDGRQRIVEGISPSEIIREVVLRELKIRYDHEPSNIMMECWEKDDFTLFGNKILEYSTICHTLDWERYSFIHFLIKI